ncbi:hypothetical protein ACU635_59220 [[Actinomadura] parvosata]|uniref:hypothetical protein n=1 Tax=[Actinomadura] parvosata TaxID=1955412 RepID=UPI00406CC585
MITHPSRLTRAHAIPLLLPSPAGHPDRTVLVLTDDGRFAYVAPQAVLEGEAGRIVLTRAELLDAEIRVLPGSGGHLASGCGPLLDDVLDYLNDWLASEQLTAEGSSCASTVGEAPGTT